MTIAPADTGALALRPDQVTFDDRQRAVLAHMGVENAPEADLRVFAHVCQRSGLDPFGRQIHMIGRDANVKDRQGNWTKVTKYTIQTGIDGYRLIGRRAADRVGATISLAAPEWADNDGHWRPVWTSSWGMPLAARVTILRDGQPFTAVAIFDEYKQTKRDGSLTSMWAQRPAGQLAKCAEALAWRMAFPQDLSGIYVDDEMHHADSAQPDVTSVAVSPVTAASFRPTPGMPVDMLTDSEVIPAALTITAPQRRKLFACFGDAGWPNDANTAEGRARRLAYISGVVGREVASTNDLTVDEAARVIEALAQDASEVSAPEAADTLPGVE